MDVAQRVLLYRVVPHNGGLVFARRDRAEWVARIHRAIKESDTWADFRRAMPPKEYSQILRSAFDDMGERRPKGTDAFDAELLPGWSDGDYPPWLQREMAEVVPIDLLQKHGRLVRTAINGTFWMIPHDQATRLSDALSAIGWLVERSELRFW